MEVEEQAEKLAREMAMQLVAIVSSTPNRAKGRRMAAEAVALFRNSGALEFYRLQVMEVRAKAINAAESADIVLDAIAALKPGVRH